MRVRIAQLHFLLLTLKHFDHIELIDRHERWNAFTFTFNPVLNGQQELELAAQLHDVAFQVLEHKHQSIKAGDYWNAEFLHRSTVVGDWIINDHCDEQIVVLVGNIQIGGSQ